MQPASADTSGHIAPNKWVCFLLPSTAQPLVADELGQKRPSGRMQTYGTQPLGSVPQQRNIRRASDGNSTATSALAIHSIRTIPGQTPPSTVKIIKQHEGLRAGLLCVFVHSRLHSRPFTQIGSWPLSPIILGSRIFLVQVRSLPFLFYSMAN